MQQRKLEIKLYNHSDSGYKSVIVKSLHLVIDILNSVVCIVQDEVSDFDIISSIQIISCDWSVSSGKQYIASLYNDYT